MRDNEVMFKSDSGEYRVVYSMWDMGDKYKLQKKENGVWRWHGAFSSPLAALTAMKRAAKEWI